MYNKLKYLLLATAFGAVSCESLDQKPLDQYEVETFWKTQAEVEYAVTGLYNGWESGSQIFYMDCVSDNSNSDFPWEGFQALGNGTATATNAGNADSRFSYVHIRRANLILENIDRATIPDNVKKRLSAEVRVLRAYRYLDLATLFGDVPLITKTTTVEESYVEPSPQAEVLQFVEEELRAAADDLDRTATPGRMSKGAALGFLARAYAFQGKHQEVANTTQEIIDLQVYSLFPDYAGIFEEENENNSEVISDIQYIENIQGYGSLGIMLPNSMGGWSSIVPTQKLVDAYETLDGQTIDESSSYDELKPYENRDPRLAATIVYPGAWYNGKYFDPLDPESNDYPSKADNASSSGYNYRKYIQDPTTYNNVWNVGVNIIVQRYAEILLLNAEANIELNNITQEVYANIDQVRERAGMPKVDQSVYNNQTKLRELVRRELRVELAGEGRRRFDIIRWGIAPEVMNGTFYGALSKGSVNPETGEVTFTSSTDRFLIENRVFEAGKHEVWPIPQSAIDASRGTLKPTY